MGALCGGQLLMRFGQRRWPIAPGRAARTKSRGATASKRSPQFPEAPTFREQGINFMDDVDAWYAVLGPAKIPDELVAKLNGDVNAVMALPDVKENLLRQGLIPVSSTPQELRALVKSDLARWARVIAEAKITVD